MHAAEQLSPVVRGLIEPGPPRWHVSVRAAVVAGLVVCGLVVAATALQGFGTTSTVPGTAGSSQYSTPSADINSGSEDQFASIEPGAGIHVHVLGSVRKPGVYVIPFGARVIDAIAAAGGLTADADAAGVNLAAPVEDGQQVLVPQVGAGVASNAVADSRINLNTADSAMMQSLPRIGPALADRIVQ